MTVPYHVINTTALKSSPERSFIYVLLLNIDDESRHKPFFMGVTNNIAKKFAKNKQASWHYNSFGRPVMIKILGTVHDDYADDALAELKRILVGSGYMFAPNGMGKERAVRYNNKTEGESYSLDRWAANFKIKRTPAKVKNNKNVENKIIINVDALANSIVRMDFLTTEELNVALKILESYSSDEGCSKVIFDNIKNKQDAENMRKTLNRLRFIWTPQHKLRPYSVNEFRLTKPFVRKFCIKDDSGV